MNSQILFHPVEHNRSLVYSANIFNEYRKDFNRIRVEHWVILVFDYETDFRHLTYANKEFQSLRTDLESNILSIPISIVNFSLVNATQKQEFVQLILDGTVTPTVDSSSIKTSTTSIGAFDYTRRLPDRSMVLSTEPPVIVNTSTVALALLKVKLQLVTGLLKYGMIYEFNGFVEQFVPNSVLVILAAAVEIARETNTISEFYQFASIEMNSWVASMIACLSSVSQHCWIMVEKAIFRALLEVCDPVSLELLERLIVALCQIIPGLSCRWVENLLCPLAVVHPLLSNTLLQRVFNPNNLVKNGLMQDSSLWLKKQVLQDYVLVEETMRKMISTSLLDLNATQPVIMEHVESCCLVWENIVTRLQSGCISDSSSEIQVYSLQQLPCLGLIKISPLLTCVSENSTDSNAMRNYSHNHRSINNNLSGLRDSIRDLLQEPLTVAVYSICSVESQVKKLDNGTRILLLETAVVLLEFMHVFIDYASRDMIHAALTAVGTWSPDTLVCSDSLYSLLWLKSSSIKLLTIK